MLKKFPQIKFDQDPIAYIAPSWEEMNELTYELSTQVIKHHQPFDRIVTLAKGGWSMARPLIDYTQIPKVASIGVKFYAGLNERCKKPQIYQNIPVSTKNENVLLFDDVADSGESLIFTKQHLLDKGAKTVTTATLFYKPHSKITPDFFAAQTTAWVIFPHEVFEMIKLIGNKWREQGLTKTEVRQRFKRFGFPSKILVGGMKLLE